MALLLSENDVRAVLSVGDTIPICEEAYRLYGVERNVTSTPSTSFMSVPEAIPTTFWIKGAHLRAGGVAGIFFGAQFGNFYFAVLDSRTGMLRGLLENAWLTKRRTGATAAVAAKWLANPHSRVAALVGAGRIGEEVIRSLSHQFSLDRIHVASRTLEGARSFVDRLQPEIGIPLRAFATAEEAARDADIVITMTVATVPFFKAGWLKPGATLLSMGGGAEVEFDVVSGIDQLFVDDKGYAMLRGDFGDWIRSGKITQPELEARIAADIGEVVCGAKPGRRDQSERIMAVIQGTAICDLAVANHAIERALARGIGQSWTTGIQQQRPADRSDELRKEARFLSEGLRKSGQTGAG